MRLVPRRTLAVLAFLAVGRAVLVIAQAWLLADTIAWLDSSPLPWLGLVVTARALLTWIGDQVGRRAAATVKHRLRDRLARHAAAQSDGGAFATLVGSGLDALDASLSGYLPQLVLAAVVPPLVLVQLFAADPLTAVIVSVTLPLVPVFGALIGLHTRDATRSQWARLHRLGGHFRDVIAGLSTLRAFDRTGHQAGVVRRMANEHRTATMRALRIAFLSGFVLELVGSLSVALVAVPVGLRLLDGRLSPTTGLLVLLLTPEAFGPLRALGTRFHAAAEGMAVLEQVHDILDAERPPVTGRTAPRPGAEIRLVDVTVTFPGRDRPALDQLSLTVRPGEKLAIVGPSGAGKSTLLHLLLGFVTPDTGQVLIDGTDLRDLDLEAWRRQLTWVPQHPHLFFGSILDNIRLGAPDAALADVRSAASAACALDFITASPRGFDTVLAANGAGLSAGQRQRVALARAHLRDAPIALLDEPTARLDLASENDVVTATRRLLHGRTAVLVAHRPAILATTDRVIRIESGRLHDVGTSRPEAVA